MDNCISCLWIDAPSSCSRVRWRPLTQPSTGTSPQSWNQWAVPLWPSGGVWRRSPPPPCDLRPHLNSSRPSPPLPCDRVQWQGLCWWIQEPLTPNRNTETTPPPSLHLNRLFWLEIYQRQRCWAVLKTRPVYASDNQRSPCARREKKKYCIYLLQIGRFEHRKKIISCMHLKK